jgi:tetratricopeptide (TPR) repeat protein
MLGRLKLTFVFTAAAVVFAPAAALEAQDGGRFRVLIPYFEPLEDADDDFGKDASKELRELMSTLLTHVAVEEGEMKDEVNRFDLDMDELNCIQTRQLASQMDAQVALCARYTEQPEKNWIVNAEIWDITSSESFAVTEVRVTEGDEDKAAAQLIFDQFDRYNRQVRSAAICGDYAASQQWENALRNCDEALGLNPDAISTRYLRAVILYEMDNFDGSLGELETVLAANPFHEEALQRAGYISVVQEDEEAGRDYYSRYLELNPGNAAIRMRIAYDLAQAGDPVGAMEFIQVGLDVDPENVDLWEQYGGFAFTAALEFQQEQALGAQDSGALSPEAAGYYRQAIDAYERVFVAKGAETRGDQLRNVINAYLQLEDLSAAVEMAERALETHGEEDNIWLVYAEALQRSDRIDEAIVALDRVIEINPDHPSAALRQGNWLIQAGRIPDAVGVLSAAAADNPAQAEQAGRMIFNEAYSNGYQKDRFDYAITGLAAAKELPNLSQEMIHQLNFWHGFSIYQLAVKAQEPQSLQTAQASLPRFQEAMRLLSDSGAYPASVNVNLAQLLDNVNTYVEIQEAIIQRGR